MTPPEAEVASPPQVAWFGHAVGRRGDGLTTYSAETVAGLVARGSEVYFHHATRDGREVPVERDHEVCWPMLRFKTVTLPRPGFRPQMERWLEQHRPQVAHCSLSFTLDDGWLGQAAVAAGAATVATFHLPFGQPGSGRAWVMRRLHQFWVPRLSAYQRVIVFSQPHLELLVQLGMDRERLVVLPNAVNTEHFSPGTSRLRQKFFPEAQLVVGYMGRLDPEKGVAALLDGFSRAKLGPRARLVIAGSGALEQKVRKQKRRDPRIIYVGQVNRIEDRIDFWRAMDIFCLPSNAEGLSLSLLEAMACGRPVAVTPAGGADQVRGGTYRLDPIQLGRSIAEFLEQTWADPKGAVALGAEARLYVERHHGIEPMLDRLMGIYQECLGSPPLVEESDS